MSVQCHCTAVSDKNGNKSMVTVRNPTDLFLKPLRTVQTTTMATIVSINPPPLRRAVLTSSRLFTQRSGNCKLYWNCYERNLGDEFG